MPHRPLLWGMMTRCQVRLEIRSWNKEGTLVEKNWWNSSKFCCLLSNIKPRLSSWFWSRIKMLAWEEARWGACKNSILWLQHCVILKLPQSLENILKSITHTWVSGPFVRGGELTPKGLRELFGSMKHEEVDNTLGQKPYMGVLQEPIMPLSIVIQTTA